MNDDDGNIVSLKLTPFFPNSRASAALMRGVAKSVSGETLDQFVLAVSGSSGNVSLRKRNESAVPLIDIPPDQRPKQPPQLAGGARQDDEEGDEEYDDPDTEEQPDDEPDDA